MLTQSPEFSFAAKGSHSVLAFLPSPLVFQQVHFELFKKQWK